MRTSTASHAFFIALFVAGVFAMLAACSGEAPVEDVRGLSEPLEWCAAPAPWPPWLEGVDVSDAQGAIDWAAARSAGVAFAFVKATQGTYDTQSTFSANWPGARHAGVARGAYHFFDPTEDGAAQAAHFLDVIGPPVPGDLPPMLDLECPDGAADCLYAGHPGRAPPPAIRARVDAFLAAIEAAMGVKPVVYTFPDYFASSGVDPTGLEVYPLFVAGVGPSGQAATGACTPVPAPWTAAAFWQYAWTGSVAGVAGDVDHDRFLGDAPALAQLSSGSGSRGGKVKANGCP
jgi:lysozyme